MSKEETEVCGNCGRYVPIGYLQPLMTEAGASAPICGVCALRVTNLMHGIQRTKFQGTQAEEVRLAAIRYYKKTKQDDYEYPN